MPEISGLQRCFLAIRLQNYGLRSLYQVAPDTFIVGQSDGINKQDEQTYFGVRRNF